MPNEPSEQKPALTIVIQTWATPIAAMIMLVIGLVGGYFARPLLEDSLGRGIVADVPVALPTAAQSGVQLPEFGSTEEVLAYLVSQASHFKGDEDAPVTYIEFSDFQ